MFNNCCSTAMVSNCTFRENTVGQNGGYARGGGVFNGAYSKSLVSNCVFSENTASQAGGGMCNDEYCTAEVVNGTFIANSASSRGGGMYNTERSSPTITNCTFSGNSSEFTGGAVSNRFSRPTFTGCIFSGNSTTGWGGGGMFSHHGFITLTNCTFVSNSVTEGFGGGINNDWVDGATLSNCVFWDNIADEGPQIALNHWTLSVTSVNYCNIQGGPSDIYIEDAVLAWGDGNMGEDLIDDNPQFVQAGHWEGGTWIEGDYHLRSQAGRWNPVAERWEEDAYTSLCVDGGDPDSDWKAELWPHGKCVNMGAYGGTPQASMSESLVGNKADLDLNGSVDLQDYAALTSCWQVEGPLKAEDMNRDAIINILDITELIQEWLWQDR